MDSMGETKKEDINDKMEISSDGFGGSGDVPS